MMRGQRIAFRGKVQKVEKHKNGKSWQVLLADLTKDNESPVVDVLWVDLPKEIEPKEITIGSIIRFEAVVKEFSVKSYYDYHERETVQLPPSCKLADLSNIVTE